MDSLPQKLSLALLVFIALVIPLSLAATYHQVNDRSEAYVPLVSSSSPGRPTPSPLPSLLPSPSRSPSPCVTRPACLDFQDPCPVKAPAGGWCPPATPAPIPGTPKSLPSLITNTLPRGITGQTYSAIIEGADQDVTSTLTLTAGSLPDGLTLQSCTQSQTVLTNVIRCQLAGTPTTSGTYPISFMLDDNRGGVSRQLLYLTLKPWFIFW